MFLNLQHLKGRRDVGAPSRTMMNSQAKVQDDIVATPLWGKCEVATDTPENGT
jgi:hypothetical protein